MGSCLLLFTRFCWDKISFWDELIPVRVCLHVTKMKPHPKMKLVAGWKKFCLHMNFIPKIQSCSLYNFIPEWSVYTSFFLFFIPGWNFISVFLTGISSSQEEISRVGILSKRQGYNFTPGWKKETKTCKSFIPGWNFPISMFLSNF